MKSIQQAWRESALSSKIEAASQVIAHNIPDGWLEQDNQRELNRPQLEIRCETVGQ